MSLPQTECAVPRGEHASVNVSPSVPLSDVAFASQVAGVPLPAEDGGEDGPVFELSAFVWAPPPVFALLFSFLSFKQPALPSTIAASKSTTQLVMIRRSSRNSDSCHCGSCVDWYDGVTKIPFVLPGLWLECAP